MEQTGIYIVVGIFLFAGGMAIAASIANWDWFFNSKNCRMLTGTLKRNASRLLYGLLGILTWTMAGIILHDMLLK
ncbi:MAG: immunity 17 family protein [Barnesiella sp.]|uniref:immunity 17 family protein n=1 Tax=Barnesiella propionica TaxID=2981781 RepID=UPI0021D2C154|nr:immunity 17 family protein [Barnesiella propionica]MCU6768339.1 immunity 17 family protein [Barnesiella propionica]